jgi:hypothetical protein
MESPLSGLAAWQALLAAVIGGLLAMVGTFAAKWWERRQEARAVRAAFAAEISALVEIARVRKHDETMRNWIERWEKGEDHKATFHGAPRERDPVFSKNVDKIGLLGDDAADVIKLYTQLEALRVQFRAIEDGRLDDFDFRRRIEYVKKALAIYEALIREAEPIARRLYGGRSK